jgi:hypothetical protein
LQPISPVRVRNGYPRKVADGRIRPVWYDDLMASTDVCHSFRETGTLILLFLALSFPHLQLDWK